MPERGESSSSFNNLINVIMNSLQANGKNTEDIEIPQKGEIRQESVIVEEVEETKVNIEELRENLQAELREKARLAEIANAKQERRKIKKRIVEEIQDEIKQVKFKQMIVGGAIGVLSVVAGTLYYLQKNKIKVH